MEPPRVSKRNPASDPRKIRRIIAEDPEWNLETIPPLTELCVKHIVKNFKNKPILNELRSKHKHLVLTSLSVDLPISITGPLVEDEDFWKRSCKDRWKICDIKKHRGNWKRMYFERNLQEAIEKHIPNHSEAEPKELLEVIQVSSPFVRRLEIEQLLPLPVEQQMTADDEDADGISEIDRKPCSDHLSMMHIIPHLKELEEFILTYGVKNCGMNFEWSLFEFTKMDCANLSKALKACRTLRLFQLRRSHLDDPKGRLLISHLLDHSSLTTLDLSHNCLGDGTGRALGKLLKGHSRLESLDVSDNNIGRDGGSAIGHALENNMMLRKLSLKLNKLGDDGVKQLLKSLLKNDTLVSLNLSANNIGEPSAQSLAEVFVGNKILKALDLSSNGFGEVAGRVLQEAMEENTTLTSLDLRLTEVSQESEYCINQTISVNQEREKRIKEVKNIIS